ncbi:MAG: fibronectin type III domain-containing protein, partial [Candidatus Cloacimonadales bacterium]|nr:fibronectin type III domain-containing protein [Candidatus Cloacimonadales bacterium]
MKKCLLLIFSVILLLSCSNNPVFDNPYDIDTELNPADWAPSNLVLTPLTATSIKLDWKNNASVLDGFKISRKVDSGAWQENIATVGVNILTWTDTNAPYGTTYSYRVRAYAGGNQSNAVEKTEAFVLSAPTNLTITPQSATSLKLTWTDTNQFEQGFKISRKVDNGAWQENIATVGVNILTWTDTNATIGTTYSYRVRAYAGGNQSNAVEKTEAFVLSAPTNLTITSQSATSLKLTWTDTNQFEQGFKISRKVDSGAWQENIATVGANVTNWVDSSINNSSQYQYRIRAYYQSHYSAYSSICEHASSFVLVQGGTFQMGGNVYSGEQPVHSVTLSSFLIGKYELTQSEWQTVMTGNNNGISATPSSFSGNPNRPVERV